MRYLVFITAFFICSLASAQPNPQPSKITEKFFPDPEIEINTPAFSKKKGFTDYDEMLVFLNALQAEFPEVVRIQYIGESQKGKAIPLVTLAKKGAMEKPVKVWIQGGLHGNEPGSTESTFHLMNKLLKDPAHAHLLDRLHIAIVPMANIDGYEKNNRDAINGLDLNRDQTKLNAPESVVLKQAFSDYSPEVALDLHEYNAYRKHFAQLSTFGISSIYDVLFLYTGNLNVPENLRNYIDERFVENARIELDKHHLNHNDYMSTTKHEGEIQFNKGATSPRSSATSYALTNCISALIEVRGVHLGRTSFKRRVHSAFLVSSSFLETAYQHVDELRAEIRKANEAQTNSVVKSKRAVYEDSIQVIDMDTRSEMPLQITVRDALKSSPVIERTRATAYLIPKEESKLLEKLQTLGLEIHYLEKTCKLEVESYLVSEYEQAQEKFEDIRIQTVQTTISTEQIDFAEGTAVVLMNQPKANLAIEVLEPEAINSFVAYEVLPTALNETLPIYRYVKPDAPEHITLKQNHHD